MQSQQAAEIAWVEGEIGELVRDAAVAYTQDDRRTIRLVAQSGRIFFLKLAPTLMPERERLDWLADMLPVPKVCAFRRGDPVDWLLTREIPGENLVSERNLADPGRVVELLAGALRRIHSLDPSGCPFRADGTEDGVVVHGDACLPNFLVHNARISGYLDLGSCRVASPTVDLQAAVWSLRYNLGDGWGGPFLSAYRWKASDPETVKSFVSAYENAS
jgi:aminoglycoside 3'-phosphotransferase II